MAEIGQNVTDLPDKDDDDNESNTSVFFRKQPS